MDVLFEDSVAIIGARKCTNYGKKVAFEIAKQLSDMNINVVSGLALGIDTYAHLGAMHGKYAKTIAVLGNGLDIRDIYPKENVKLFEKILENDGTILSEYIPGTKANKYNFPQRNRIVSGVSDKILVVEATNKSGTLITVRLCIRPRKRSFCSSWKYI